MAMKELTELQLKDLCNTFH